MGVARYAAMRSAGRVSRVLVVLGLLALLLPATSASAARGNGPSQKQKAKNAALAKKSKQRMAVGKSKMKNGQKGAKPKAAGFLPRPAAEPAGKRMGETKLAGTRTAGMTASKSAARARTTKARRPVARKTRTAKRTRKMSPAKRRMARTQRTRSRSMGPEFAAEGPEELTAQAAGRRMGAPGEMGPMEFGAPEKQPGRFRRFLSATGRVIKKTAKVAGYVAIVAAPAAVMAVGGLPIAFAIGAPAIFLGIPLAIGLAEQRAKAKAGYGEGDIQEEMLQRYMTRQMLENQDLNGPGPGNGVAGVGGLNTLGNMINPGGIGGQQMP